MKHKASTVSSIDELNKADKIIIYGAGKFGKSVLIEIVYEILEISDKNKIIIWDENYIKIDKVQGYIVSKPDFENFPDKNIPVIVAISPKKNPELYEEIIEKFKKFNFRNIVNLEDIGLRYKPKIISKDVLEKAAENNNDIEYQDNIDFSNLTPKVKTIAFYLPQFHDIPENDKWWGKGFTEWTNTRKAKPNWKGHYQPREPHDDLGYYDLTDVEIIRKQAHIAKQHGIYGWSIYYYWFSGRRLLEKPLDILLEHKDIDINFCLFWANASWTKQWIGDNKTMLVEQKYLENDPENFINDLKKYTDDSRYIRLNGKPIIHIYQSNIIPNFENIVERWRKHAKKIGIGEICIFVEANNSVNKYLNIENNIIDGTLPLSIYFPIMRKFIYSLEMFNNSIMNYKECVDAHLSFFKRNRFKRFFYNTCFALWDNTPRYKNKGFLSVDYEFSLLKLYEFMKFNVDEAIETQKEFTFIFSWNEWAEGSYIEPDKKYGYAIINTLSKAIYGLPFLPSA